MSVRHNSTTAMTVKDRVCQWLLEYAYSQRMTEVIKVLQTRYPEPPANSFLMLHMAACTLDTIVARRDYTTFAIAFQLASQLYEHGHDFLQFKLFVKVMRGIKMMHLVHLLKQGDEHTRKVTLLLNTYFPRDGFKYTHGDDKVVRAAWTTEGNLRKFILQLLADDRLRRTFLARDCAAMYGEEFATKLHQLTAEFSRVIEAAAPPTVIHQLISSGPIGALAQSLSAVGGPAVEILLDAVVGIKRMTATAVLEVVCQLGVLRASSTPRHTPITLDSDDDDMCSSQSGAQNRPQLGKLGHPSPAQCTPHHTSALCTPNRVNSKTDRKRRIVPPVRRSKLSGSSPSGDPKRRRSNRSKSAVVGQSDECGAYSACNNVTPDHVSCDSPVAQRTRRGRGDGTSKKRCSRESTFTTTPNANDTADFQTEMAFTYDIHRRRHALPTSASHQSNVVLDDAMCSGSTGKCNTESSVSTGHVNAMMSSYSLMSDVMSDPMAECQMSGSLSSSREGPEEKYASRVSPRSHASTTQLRHNTSCQHPKSPPMLTRSTSCVALLQTNQSSCKRSSSVLSSSTNVSHVAAATSCSRLSTLNRFISLKARTSPRATALEASPLRLRWSARTHELISSRESKTTVYKVFQKCSVSDNNASPTSTINLSSPSGEIASRNTNSPPITRIRGARQHTTPNCHRSAASVHSRRQACRPISTPDPHAGCSPTSSGDDPGAPVSQHASKRNSGMSVEHLLPVSSVENGDANQHDQSDELFSDIGNASPTHQVSLEGESFFSCTESPLPVQLLTPSPSEYHHAAPSPHVDDSPSKPKSSPAETDDSVPHRSTRRLNLLEILALPRRQSGIPDSKASFILDDQTPIIPDVLTQVYGEQ